MGDLFEDEDEYECGILTKTKFFNPSKTK